MQNVVGGHWPAVVVLIRTGARANDSALERSADEQPLTPAVGIDRGSRSHISFSSPAHRSGCDARVRTESYVTSFGKCANCTFVIEHDDKIGHLRTDLRPETRAARTHKRRPRPTMSGSRHDHALASLSAKEKAGLYHADNGQAPRMSKNSRGNTFLGHVTKLPNGDR